jgi:cell division protein FtsI (penicillin-binding protein 3)
LSTLRPLRRRGKPTRRREGLSRRSRHRLFAVLVTFALAFALITYKLVSIQGLDNTTLAKVTDAEVVSTPLPGLRGSILASNGDELALSEMRPTIFADPGEIREAAMDNKVPLDRQAATEAVSLAPILDMPVATLAQDFVKPGEYVLLATDQSQALVDAVTKLDLPGIAFGQAPARLYPDGDLAAPLLGGVNSNGGYSGLESEYNQVLDGRSGLLVESVDKNYQPIAGSITENKAAVNGEDILTTINEALQYQTEQALMSAVRAAHSKGGTAVVMNSQTGALLAVASVVSSPKGPVEAPTAQAFTDVYEPGSVAKIITVSAGLAQGKITPSTKVTIPNGYEVAGTEFHDAETHPTEQLTPAGILAQSSNIGAIQVAQKLGSASLYGYEKAYGLTQRTAVAFPAQSAGLVTPLSQFSGTTLPTLAFGEANAVTAVQMIAAVNTIAHGGVYISPRLVTATVGKDGEEQPTAYPAPHRVVPAAVAHEVTGMLEQVVSTGTGTAAKIGSYAVAGKTGTALVYQAKTGYLAGHYVSSFAGFAPAQKPVITAMVVIDNTPQYGAQASAPTFAQITSDALIDLGIPTAGAQPAPSVNAIPSIKGKPETSILGE